MTLAQLMAIVPNINGRGAAFIDALNAAMSEFGITTPPRQAAFVAQVLHESAELGRLEENLNYSAQGLADTWPGRYAVNAKAKPRVPNPLALQIQRDRVAIANHTYALRLGNGDVASGDGWRYRGRGLIQLTGRLNYGNAGAALGLDLTGNPDHLLQPVPACRSAAWFWREAGCNALADKGDFEGITRRINGGLIGLDDRKRLWARAKAALGA
ncbi:glycoside hydrolase family 19 protein [Chitinimonas taiwanensis]|uniref:glycoside hydrolase family 19 protein n=1 Tax=Chitinimonas taiwanensis TaxID=240412 RepID=UPI0035AF0D5E